MQGTHSGEWRNTLPTAKFLDIEMLNTCRIEGGKICEQWMVYDMDEILKHITTAGRSSFADQSSEEYNTVQLPDNI